jgi:non-homologous end joining protein Ku
MARRSIWKGSITFGLITIPIKLYTAVGREQEKIDLHLLHEKDGTRIHYERQCEKGHRRRLERDREGLRVPEGEVGHHLG